ncbi:nuclease-related domain-containing protein [Sutcliffiella horikoshii]|uniref:NERD domain-containing protein n=1 Tax=Sutcliffiella horikoshii TaxID=79883 RepID=A0A5D4TAY6_9BACI|nr:nuclease-related domain-containing protein [Sutcliffiella horikoshii]TYS72787.1 NERD domain-containing protein [Sutcliffiella horikoshii]
MNKQTYRRSIMQCKLDALHRRLSPQHEKTPQIESELGKRRSGDFGENSIDYYLSQLSGIQDCIVVKGARLLLNKHHFQMDTLLLFPSFFIILETKHLTGTLLFDPDYQQLIQIKKEDINREISRQDPILQVKMQYNQFKRWLENQGIEGYPGYCFVGVTNQNAIVKALSNPALVQEFVVRSPALTIKINDIQANQQQTRSTIYSPKEISLLITKHHALRNINILKEFDIDPTEIMTGVACPDCNKLAMEKHPRKWSCPNCKHQSKNAHTQTLIYYSFLFGTNISIREMCRILHINNVRSARRMIKELSLKQIGTTNNARYCLKNLQEQQNAPSSEGAFVHFIILD